MIIAGLLGGGMGRKTNNLFPSTLQKRTNTRLWYTGAVWHTPPWKKGKKAAD